MKGVEQGRSASRYDGTELCNLFLREAKAHENR